MLDWLSGRFTQQNGIRRNGILFSGSWYLDRYNDLRIAGVNPWDHFHEFGAKEMRQPHPLFDVDYYIGQLPESEKRNLHLGDHYNEVGAAKGYSPFPLFNAEHYLSQVTDADAKKDPFSHYLRVGGSKGLSPHPLLDVQIYRAELAKSGLPSPHRGQTLLEHFLSVGGRLRTHDMFDTEMYLDANPDVKASGLPPLYHYLKHGFKENRRPHPEVDPCFLAVQLGEFPAKTDPLTHHVMGHQAVRSTENIDRSKSAIQMSGAVDKNIKVRVGILVYNESREQISRIVSSAKHALKRCPVIDIGILMFDNGRTIPREHIPEGVDYIPSGLDSGFPVGQNSMMRRAFTEGADVYIGANPDGAFHPDCIARLLEMNAAQKGLALIEAMQFPDEHPKYFDPETLEAGWVSGACFVVSRQVWEKTGGFDENIYLYCDDVDLSWRARLAGFKTMICPAALFYHDVSDRGYDVWRYSHMLTSARYLGHKWKNPEFRAWAEQELSNIGMLADKAELPLIDHLPTIDNAEGVCNFEYGFHFSAARWGR